MCTKDKGKVNGWWIKRSRMVNQNTSTLPSHGETARQTALKLEDDKRKKEDELKKWLSVLEINNVDMNEALVDVEGYPRSDTDVYQVRDARQRIIYIRNDLRKIMSDIEKCLHTIHAANNPPVQVENMVVEINCDTPIAKVISITPGSPSDEAGLKVGDMIVNFGSVNSSNFNSLADISIIVLHSVNQFIKVVVLRNEVTTNVYLKPHSWPGNGMLGCVILPFENVDR